MNRFLTRLFTCLGLLIIAGCSSTYVTNTWTKPNARPAALRRIAVLALVQEESRALRQQMEARFVEELGRRNYEAYSTFAAFGPDRLDRSNEQQAIARLKKNNTDAVLTVVLLDKKREQSYVPGRVTYTPVGAYYNRFWGYYTTIYDRMYQPGYYTNDTRYFWESNLYDLQQPGDDLVYSAQSESFDPSGAETLARQYARAVVKSMEQSGVLTAAK